jgi:hypothetical protein
VKSLTLIAVASLSVMPTQFARGQFVDITAEVELYRWSSALPECFTIHCTVGTNCWQIDGDLSDTCRVTNWFTGARIVEHRVVERPPSPLVLREPAEFGPPVGKEGTDAYDCPGGNPVTQTRGPDPLSLRARIIWLAFCSGPYLRHEERELRPPDDNWKEYTLWDHFTDRTTTFPDALGLPKSIDLSSKGSIALQYRMTASTNILGWEFPTQFHLAQFRPAHLPGTNITAGTHGWELDFTATATVTAIGPGTKPQIPPRVLIAAGKQ